MLLMEEIRLGTLDVVVWNQSFRDNKKLGEHSLAPSPPNAYGPPHPRNYQTQLVI